MTCRDCDSDKSAAIEQPVVFQFPTGYTGCTLGSLCGALPPPIPGTPYNLPRITGKGVIIYTPNFEGQLPPPEINGYQRDFDDPWRFYPLWKECVMRIHGTSRNRQRGSINVRMICNHPECQYAGKYVTVLECETCSYRLEPYHE
jgi:hypothetical protein